MLQGTGQMIAGNDTRYLQAQAQTQARQLDVPKELGIIQRVEGLAGGLDDLKARLENFIGRVGGGTAGKGEASPIPNGLPTHLQLAENRLRECLSLVGQLNDAF